MTSTEEIWKDIPGYEGLYKASSMGSIRLCTKTFRAGWQRTMQTKKERLMTGARCVNGYMMCALTKDGVCKNYYMHRLVAITFIKNNENKRNVNHKNGIRHDNRVSNLEWATHSENNKHAYVLGRISTFQGKVGSLSDSAKAVVSIAPDGKEEMFGSITEAAEKFNVFRSNVCKVLKGKYKKTGNMRFRYAEVKEDVVVEQEEKQELSLYE